MLEHRPAIEAEAGDAGDREFDRQHIARLAGRIVAGSTMGGTHRAVGKSNKALLEKLNNALAAIKADGTYQKINDQWFPQ
ncbi:transporter substrate-binding domain-containing protein [Staphylococcus aureus]|uniref:transporter substrate-binding domain-containing protein n=1 Tax=Staphylococcus aureus TaxID=1280 RepID=UPI003F6AD33B